MTLSSTDNPIITLITEPMSSDLGGRIQDGGTNSTDFIIMMNCNNNNSSSSSGSSSSHELLVALLWDTVLDLFHHAAFVPLLLVGFVFGPMLLYTGIAVSSWIFWFLTRLIETCFQYVYVAFQWIMITVDVGGFLLLNLYSIICQAIFMTVTIVTTTTTSSNTSLFHSFVAVLSSAIWFVCFMAGWNTHPLPKSERRIWRERLNATGSYEAFLKLRIQPKKQQPQQQQQQQPKEERPDASLATVTTISRPKPPPQLPPGHEELGKRTAQVLMATTQRLFDARRQAEQACRDYGDCIQQQQQQHHQSERDNDNSAADVAAAAATAQESLDRLQYVLSTVLTKRNHLQLERRLVENAQTVNHTGRYGFSNPTRHAIRTFYEQVEKGLEFWADAPILRVSHIHKNDNLPLSPKESPIQPSQLGRDDKDEDDEEKKEEKELSSSPSSSLSPTISPISSSSMAPSVFSLSDQPRNGSHINFNNNFNNNNFNNQHHHEPLLNRIRMLRRMKHNMGRTALVLSGGSRKAPAMSHHHHVGVIRALLESKLYSEIPVICASSGGSITAALCAMKTPQELFQQQYPGSIPNGTSTDDMSSTTTTTNNNTTTTGEPEKPTIQWFPTALLELASSYWFQNTKLSVNQSNDDFWKACEFYYGNVTFDEAFEKTGKHVCISVSVRRVNPKDPTAAGGGGGDDGNAMQEEVLLLNHLSTPRVTLASAVAASCAVPGVTAMAPPTLLMVKNTVGKLEPLDVDWMEGSVFVPAANVPLQRISTLFAVSNFIVSQINVPVIVPSLLHHTKKELHSDAKSLYHRLLCWLEWDIQSRAMNLSRLGFFPVRLDGPDMLSPPPALESTFPGITLTIVPRCFPTSPATLVGGWQTLWLWLWLLRHPIRPDDDWKKYIKNGEMATWPLLNAIREMTRLETVLKDCLTRLEQQQQQQAVVVGNRNPAWCGNNSNSNNDDIDVDSLCLGTASFGRTHPHATLFRRVQLVTGVVDYSLPVVPTTVARPCDAAADDDISHSWWKIQELRQTKRKLEHENQALQKKLHEFQQQQQQQPQRLG